MSREGGRGAIAAAAALGLILLAYVVGGLAAGAVVAAVVVAAAVFVLGAAGALPAVVGVLVVLGGAVVVGGLGDADISRSALRQRNAARDRLAVSEQRARLAERKAAELRKRVDGLEGDLKASRRRATVLSRQVKHARHGRQRRRSGRPKLFRGG